MQGVYSVLEVLLPFEWLEPEFMKNALLAVVVAAPLFGTLGSVVVSNQMAFFSDAIGHSALTGIAIGVLLGIKEPVVAMVGFSLFLGAAIISVKSRGKSSADTIIGVFSSTAVALGIVLLSATGNFSKYQKYLVGDILSITPAEIAELLASLVVTVALFALLYNKMLLSNLHATFARSRGVRTLRVEIVFALLTAAIVTVSIRWTGLLVINSLLVLPAASSRMVSMNSRGYIFLSNLISLFSCVAGLFLSWRLGSASGATIVLVNAAVFALCLLFSLLRK